MSKVHVPLDGHLLCSTDSLIASMSADDVCSHCARVVKDMAAALEPFAEMARGWADSRPDDAHCAVFPSMKVVRAARAALAKARGES